MWLGVWCWLVGLGPAEAIEPSLELGVQGGVVAPLDDEQLATSWLLAPSLSLWLDRRVGLGVRTSLSQAPRATSAGRPLWTRVGLEVAIDLLPSDKPAPVHPLLLLQGGVTHTGGDLGGPGGFAGGGLGLLVPVIGPLAIRLDVQGSAHVPDGRPVHGVVTASTGVALRLGLTSDKDLDGIRDRRDQCPTVLEDEDGFEDEDGCPDEDNDQDGIPDVLDGCPMRPETPDGIEDFDGCPETDEDGDGIRGKRDRCPNEPEDFDGVEDYDGCPEECMALLPEDQGGDPDNLDGCPEDF